MKWTVGMTVFPGRSYLKVTFKMFNRTPLAHSMLCFTNAAVHVNPQYRVIYPPAVEYGVQHAKHEFIRWPISHEVYAGVDYRARRGRELVEEPSEPGFHLRVARA